MTTTPGQGLHGHYSASVQGTSHFHDCGSIWHQLGRLSPSGWAISATENVTANQGNAKLIHFFLSAQYLPAPLGELAGSSALLVLVEKSVVLLLVF